MYFSFILISRAFPCTQASIKFLENSLDFLSFSAVCLVIICFQSVCCERFGH